MKNIFILSAIITTLLFIACGNSTQKEKPIDKKQVEQFTPEEIAYNDSIKDIPMDYTILLQEIFLDEKSDENFFPDERKLNANQQTAYLKTYSLFCIALATQVSSRVRYTEGAPDLIYLTRVKLLNKDGKDIIPLIDFPDRQEKQDSIWNEIMGNIKKNLLVGHRLDMYQQPIVNKGDSMVLDLNKDLLESFNK